MEYSKQILTPLRLKAKIFGSMQITLPIAKPPWTALGKHLESMVRKALHDYQMVEGVQKIAIALSGGKDSLALLYFLKALSGYGYPNWIIYAVHVEGEFSCGPSITKSFLQAVCKELDIPLIVKKSEKKLQELECYSCSRERRKLLFEGAKEAGATTIAFGHHKDDSVQTLLLNLLHKAEFEGIMPKIKMVDYGVTIIRPLIFISEAEIIEFANMYQFKRISCQCPIGQKSKRKQVESLIKQMESLFPRTRHNLFLAERRYGSNKALKPFNFEENR